ncbi:Dolichyl pyrophosphate Glc1Man9GlcNAc2 alpha-1,3-glucosyltransferase [Balamuthia mandrillaris]
MSSTEATEEGGELHHTDGSPARPRPPSAMRRKEANGSHHQSNKAVTFAASPYSSARSLRSFATRSSSSASTSRPSLRDMNGLRERQKPKQSARKSKAEEEEDEDGDETEEEEEEETEDEEEEEDDGLLKTKSLWKIKWEELEFLREVGEGSFGRVWQGRYLNSTDVAIKLVFPPETEEEAVESRKYLRREIGLLKGLRHPNIVSFMGVCKHIMSNGEGGSDHDGEQHTFIVTEFLSGGDLASLLFTKTENDEQQVPLSWSRRLRMAKDVAKAMDFLHQKGILHRDIKAENMLLGQYGEVKLADMGLARRTKKKKNASNGTGGDGGKSKVPFASRTLKRQMTFAGTDAWMAPEIITGMDYNEKVDVFGYGAFLLELITRQQPPDRSADDCFLFDPIKLQPLIPADTPDGLLELADSCIQKEPRHRPNFGEILNRIDELLAEVETNEEENGENTNSRWKEEKEGLLGRLHKQDKIVNEKVEIINELEKQKEALEEERDAVKSQLEEATWETRNLQEEVLFTKKEVEDAKRREKKLQEEKAKLEEQTRQLRMELEKKEKEQEQQTEQTQLEEQTRRLRMELEAKEKEAEEKEKEHTEEKARLEDQTRRLRTELDKKEQEIEEIAKEITRLQSELSHSRKNFEELKLSVAAKRKEEAEDQEEENDNVKKKQQQEGALMLTKDNPEAAERLEKQLLEEVKTLKHQLERFNTEKLVGINVLIWVVIMAVLFFFFSHRLLHSSSPSLVPT